MSWFTKISAKKWYGFKVVGFNKEKNQAYSLYGGAGFPISIEIGNIIEAKNPKGFFLGSTKNYVLQYYSDLTDDEELLLTYEFDIEDLLSSFPGKEETEGEIRVRKAKLINIETIDKN